MQDSCSPAAVAAHGAPGDRVRARRAQLLLGMRDTVPLLLGAAPFGLIFGAMAAPGGLAAAGALAMSAVVFAGSAQFIALTLLGSGAAGAVIVLTTLVVNLRHLLYSATLLPFVARLPLRWRVLLAFWLTDETFAVVHQHYAAQARQGAVDPDAHWYFLGSCLAMYSNWLAWTVVGVWAGHGWPWLTHWGLEFAMAATFIAMIAPMLRQRPALVAALVAGALALLGRGLPYKLGLMVAALGGVVAAVLADEWLAAQAPAAESPADPSPADPWPAQQAPRDSRNAAAGQEGGR